MIMSEQDKRPVFMGNFERFKKETQVKHEDVMRQTKKLNEKMTFALAMATVAIIASIASLAI
jgi:hypothetical protein